MKLLIESVSELSIFYLDLAVFWRKKKDKYVHRREVSVSFLRSENSSHRKWGNKSVLLLLRIKDGNFNV